MLERTEQVRVNEVDSCTLWNLSTSCKTPRTFLEFPSRGPLEVPALSSWISQHVGACLYHFQPRHAQTDYTQKPTTGPQTSLDTNCLKQM